MREAKLNGAAWLDKRVLVTGLVRDHRASQAYRIAMLRNSLLKFYAETQESKEEARS